MMLWCGACVGVYVPRPGGLDNVGPVPVPSMFYSLLHMLVMASPSGQLASLLAPNTRRNKRPSRGRSGRESHCHCHCRSAHGRHAISIIEDSADMCIVALSPMARVALPMVEWHRKTTAVGHGLGLVPPVVQAQVSQVSCACGRVRACVRACARSST